MEPERAAENFYSSLSKRIQDPQKGISICSVFHKTLVCFLNRCKKPGSIDQPHPELPK